MSEDPYLPYEKDHEQMILRDYLAVDRTMMTNETSFMSYIRTALTLIAAGATLIKFFGSELETQILGVGFMAIGGMLALYGYNRFRKVDTILLKVKGETLSRVKKIKKSRNFWGSALGSIVGRKSE
jgi:putative membrane protein